MNIEPVIVCRGPASAFRGRGNDFEAVWVLLEAVSMLVRAVRELVALKVLIKFVRVL